MVVSYAKGRASGPNSHRRRCARAPQVDSRPAKWLVTIGGRTLNLLVPEYITYLKLAVSQAAHRRPHPQQPHREALVAFERRTAREVAGPEAMRRLRDGQKIVSLQRPGERARAIHRVRVARRRRIHRVHSAPVRYLLSAKCTAYGSV